MARKGRKGDRVEPVFDVRVKDGTLGFGLDESDRTAAKPSGREARLPKPKAKKTAKAKAVEAEPPAGRKGGKTRQSRKGGARRHGAASSPASAASSAAPSTGRWSSSSYRPPASPGSSATTGRSCRRRPNGRCRSGRPNVRILADDGALITNRGDNAGAEPHPRPDAALPARGGDRDRGPALLLAFRHRPDRPRPRRRRQPRCRRASSRAARRSPSSWRRTSS